MLICATNLSFIDLNFKDFLNKINKIGFNNIEISPYLIMKDPLSANNILKIKKILDKSPIKICALQSIFYNLNKKNCDIYNPKLLFNHFKKIVKFSNRFSIKKISIGSCPSRIYTSNQNLLWKSNLDLFKKFSEISINYNINLCIEPLSNKFGNNFLKNSYETVDFIKKINMKNIKLLLDTGNLEENNTDFYKFFLKFRKYINHIHIRDKKINIINMSSIKRYLSLLKKLNYNETVSIEYLSSSNKKFEKISKIIGNI